MNPRWMWCVLAVLFYCGSPVVTPADELVTGKLGYGFAPGLVAGKDYIAGQLIIGIKEGMKTQSLTQAAAAQGGRLVKEITGTALLLEFPSEQAAVTAVSILLRHPDVLFIERNGFMSIPPEPTLPYLQRGGKEAPGDAHSLAVSGDAGTGHQWHLTVIRKTAILPVLSTSPPTVAVIDTGVDYTHSDLSGKVIFGKNSVANNRDPYDDNEHGTHVAGIIAAKGGNGFYGEGICPNCKILAVKVLGESGSGNFFNIADGMHFAHTFATIPPTRVLNMSLGGPSSILIATEVDHIKAADKVLVAAAGNSNTTDTAFAFPGADPDTALRVMATEEHDCRAYFSNFSPSTTPTQYNIAAPGWDVLSTTPNEEFASFSGTSMASPVTAGAAALVWGQLPTLTRAQLVSRLISNGRAIRCGFAAVTRRVDVRKAILGTSETVVVGRILDPFTGRAPSPNTTPTHARLFLGTTPLKVDGSNRGGSYEMTGLTAATGVALRGDRAGYVPALLRSGIIITSNAVVGPFIDALPKARPTGNATITLDWKNIQPILDTPGCINSCNGWDFDLLVKLPSGAYIGPLSSSSLSGSPFVTNPRDSMGDLNGLFGIPTQSAPNSAEPLETVVIGSAAANGVYRVVVDKWYTGISNNVFNPFWTGSRASVQMYNGATSFGNFYSGAPLATCTTQRYWHVGNLTKSGTFYTWTNVNRCTNALP